MVRGGRSTSLSISACHVISDRRSSWPDGKGHGVHHSVDIICIWPKTTSPDQSPIIISRKLSMISMESVQIDFNNNSENEFLWLEMDDETSRSPILFPQAGYIMMINDKKELLQEGK